jgi:hypothetical protein
MQVPSITAYPLLGSDSEHDRDDNDKRRIETSFGFECTSAAMRIF